MPLTTFVGDTGTPLIFTLQAPDRFGVVRPINVSGFTNSNFSLHLREGSTTIICAGNWTVIDGPNGVVSYQPLASELATAGSCTMYLAVILPSGPKTMQTDTLTINTVF